MTTTDDVLFHASPLLFDPEACRPLTHFGTFRASWMRVGEVLHKHGWRHHPDLRSAGRESEMPGYIHPVRLAVSNPCTVSDGKDVLHSPNEIGRMLRRRRTISAAEEAMLRCDAPAPVLVAILREKGFDGLVYDNLFEDVGSRSFVVFDCSQVVSAGPPFRTTLGDILAGALADVDPATLATAETEPTPGP